MRVGDTDHVLDVTGGTTTLADLATSIDELDGVRAQVVQDGAGHRLVLSAEQTGTANALQVTATDLASLQTWDVDAATDAIITMGATEFTRSSNTVTDLIAGVTLDLKQVTTDDVTIGTSRDTDAVVKKVKALVDGLNGVLETLGTLTKYDPETKASGALQGDSTARQLATQLRTTVSGVVAGLSGDHTYAGSVGIQLTRTGTVELDEAKLAEALAANPDAVANLFARTGRAADPASGVSFVYASDTTQPGTYGVALTAAATVARATGATYAPANAVPPVTFTITTAGGATAEVTISDAQATAAEVAAEIRAALDEAEITAVEVSTEAGAITLAETRSGSAYGFTVAHVGGGNDGAGGEDLTVLGLAGEHLGTDAQGEILDADGVPVTTTASGSFLTATSGDATDLRVRADTPGTWEVTYSTGLGGALSQLLATYEGSDGLVAGQQDRIDGQISDYDDRIAAFEIRLALRETNLRKQFTAMETAMARLSDQGNWIAQQMAGLSAMNQQQ